MIAGIVATQGRVLVHGAEPKACAAKLVGMTKAMDAMVRLEVLLGMNAHSHRVYSSQTMIFCKLWILGSSISNQLIRTCILNFQMILSNINVS